MNDATNKMPLHVSTNGNADSYIRTPFGQLDDLLKLLSDHHVLYTIDEYAISIDDGPEMVVVDLGRGVDPKHVQQILDGCK